MILHLSKERFESDLTETLIQSVVH